MIHINGIFQGGQRSNIECWKGFESGIKTIQVHMIS